MNNDKTLKNEVRKRIYDLILNNPGLHFGKLSRELNMPKTTLNHHLTILQKSGLIKRYIEGRYHRYYISQEVSNMDKKIINVFRQETSRNIVLYLLVNVGATQTELSKSLEKHPTTIEFYLKKLIEMDIIKRLFAENKKIIIPRVKEPKFIEYTPISNDVIYKIKDPVAVFDSIVTYQNSFNDPAVDDTLDLLKDHIKEKFNEKVPKKTKKPQSEADEALKLILKIFPLPWCA